MDNRAEDALIDVRARLVAPFVAGVASTREASRCVGANGIGVTVNRADDGLIDVRARLVAPFVAGVASTREASRCVGANGIGVTVNRADDGLIDVRARLPVPSWPVWQAHEKPPTVLVQYASMAQSSDRMVHSSMSEHVMPSSSLSELQLQVFVWTSKAASKS